MEWISNWLQALENHPTVTDGENNLVDVIGLVDKKTNVESWSPRNGSRAGRTSDQSGGTIDNHVSCVAGN